MFAVHGHAWQHEPYAIDGSYLTNPLQLGSTHIADNPLSLWEGARMGHGPMNHFEAVLENGAGGAFEITDGFLYRDQASFLFAGGIWGILRVGERPDPCPDDALTRSCGRWPSGRLPSAALLRHWIHPNLIQTRKRTMMMILKRQTIHLILLLSLLGAAGAAGEPSGQEPAAAGHRIVREGIAIEFEMEPVAAPGVLRDFREGDTVDFRFRITDTHTGTPLSRVYPAAWMDRKPTTEASRSDERQRKAIIEDEGETCQDKVEAFIGGSLFAPPELDLNVYYVLALNNDATISVVDSLFGFGTTKLLDMIFL